MLTDYKLRLARPEDVAALLEIYKPFVISEQRELSDVSFEYELPSVAEFTERLRNISATYPYIVCEKAGRLLGYVYAHAYIARAAYQWGAEATIYLAPEGQSCGLGRAMYGALEELLRLQGVELAYACVTASNEHSVRMHEALGYRIIGTFKDCGFKHGHWLDMVWLEKRLQPQAQEPQPLKRLRELDAELVAQVLRKYER